MKKIAIVVTICIAFIYTYASALYKSNSQSNVTLKAATFSVSASSNDTNINLTAGQTEASYMLTVNNGSEVDVKYNIVLSNLPTGLKVKLDNGSYVQESNHSITFTNAGNLLVNGTKTRNHTLTFTAPLSVGVVTNQQANINVEFSQKLN